ncbi:probable low affinity copper uptake protein 2 [Anneissia japonica]|uniref:probable low affinity copper uptake protein 2 n=1 Tax=Anneissia japonica TaxID=1529436 RepID=UPI0014257956|nr:probable low affinity copper uptake protein 2 [Anneissia japonica]
MHMTFYLSTNVGKFLFEKWTVESVSELFGAIAFVCVLAFILGILSVAVSFVQSRYKANPLHTTRQSSHGTDSPTALIAPLRIPTSINKIKQKRLRLHVARSVLHLLKVVVGYFLMLTIMTYNGYIAIAIFVSSALTYFALSPLRDKYSRGPLNSQESINHTGSISGSSHSFSQSTPGSYPTSI